MNKRKISVYLLGTLLTGALAMYLFHPLKSKAQINKTKESHSAKQSGPANFDAFGAIQPSFEQNKFSVQDGANAPLSGGHLVQYESRLDVPTFLWANDQGQPKAVNSAGVFRKSDTESAARAHLLNYASRYRLSKTDVAKAEISSVHDTGSGAIIVKLKQTVSGIEVFRDELNVVMNRNLQLIALTGYLTGDHTADSFSAQDFALQPADALAKAAQDLSGKEISAAAFASSANDKSSLKSIGRTKTAAAKKEQNPYLLFTADNAVSDVAFGDEPSRVKRVLFHLPEGYVPAYYVETSVNVPSDESIDVNGTPGTDELAYSYIISAVDGQILFRNNLTASEVSTLRVWADPNTLVPYDTPAGNDVHPKLTPAPDGVQYPFLPQNNITLNNYPFSRNDPWLPAGSTETLGNNVDAFANLINGTAPNYTATATDNGYGPVANPYDGVLTFAQGGGDFRARTTTANIFTHTYDATGAPTTAEARQSDIQQLFYNINFLHDWFYDAGFNEASGNAQTDNFGRGGLGNDSIKAQVQDISARNNANMATGADGSRPRMRMYTFDAVSSKYLEVLSPAAIAGQRAVGTSQSGPQSFDLTNQIVYAEPNNACTALTNAAAVSGKIAMVQYPATLPTGCNISMMYANLQNAGASAFLLVWVASSPTLAVNVTGNSPANTLPFLSISFNNAAGIKTQLANSVTVTARFRRDPVGNDRDGTIDNQIVFHEWGHYISNRLINNGSGLSNMMGSGMGEGWADFNAMLALTVRAEDVNVPSNSNWNGAYALATYATSGGSSGGTNQGYYYGIRRTPYSTDLTKDSLTFKHIQNGVALPNTSPYASGQDGANNAEVHNTGEVWATMLWECYASLLRDTTGNTPRLTFAQAQNRMKNYIVAAYKMTPSSPTLLEARDAVILAAYANDPQDGLLFAQAFAKRGAGTRAVAPDRNSTTNVGVTESYVLAGDASYNNAAVGDSYRTRDNDGYLDNGERGVLTVTANNTGSTALTNPTATISSNNPGISFPNGPKITFSNALPGQTMTGTIVAESSTTQSGAQPSDFTITFDDPQFLAPANVGHFFEYINVNELPASSATDTVEPRRTVWTTSYDTTLNAPVVFNRAKSTTALNYFWNGPDSDVRSDQYLTSPAVTVDGSGSLNVQFDHSWSFEATGTTYYDGGVVEMSVNGGAWADISTTAYNGAITTTSDNPIGGRSGFVGTSSGTIHTTLTKAVAAGSTVQVRFRIAGDSGGGSGGWNIDNIAFSGITQTPFYTLVADPNLGPTAASVTVSGKVVTNGRGLSNARVELKGTNGTPKFVTTNVFGNFTFNDVSAGSTYIIDVSAKRYSFSPQVVSINDNLSGLIFSSH